MPDNSDKSYRWLSFVLDPRWIEVIAQAWHLGRKIIRGLANEGIYEVLDYECRLVLKDKTGNLATIQKREKLRCLQDYVTSYQDQAGVMAKYFLDIVVHTVSPLTSIV